MRLPGLSFYQNVGGAHKERQPVADGDAGTSGTEGGSGGGTFTQADMDAATEAARVAQKAEGDDTYGKLWTEAKAAKERAKAFEGLDPTEARAALTRLKELEQDGAGGEAGMSAEKMREIRADLEKTAEEKWAPVETENVTLKGRLRELQLDNVVKGVMAKHGVKAERIDALFRLSSEQFDLNDEGEPMLKDHPGRDVAKFVAEELATEYPEFYMASGSSGGGASKSTAGSGGRVRTVSKSDKAAVAANLEGIADGSVEVTD